MLRFEHTKTGTQAAVGLARGNGPFRRLTAGKHFFNKLGIMEYSRALIYLSSSFLRIENYHCVNGNCKILLSFELFQKHDRREINCKVIVITIL